MNDYEMINSIQLEMLTVIQKLDEILENRVNSGRITTEQFLFLSSSIREYSEECQNIVEVFRMKYLKD